MSADSAESKIYKDAASQGLMPKLTAQQSQLIMSLRQGMPLLVAARTANMSYEAAERFCMESEKGIAALNFSASLNQAQLQVTRDLITVQLYEERARSSTAMEGIKALTEIAKINGLYETKISVRNGDSPDEGHNVKTAKQLERLSTPDLLAELDNTGVLIDLDPIEIKRD